MSPELMRLGEGNEEQSDGDLTSRLLVSRSPAEVLAIGERGGRRGELLLDRLDAGVQLVEVGRHGCAHELFESCVCRRVGRRLLDFNLWCTRPPR